jgi:hypothetical protein
MGTICRMSMVTKCVSRYFERKSGCKTKFCRLSYRWKHIIVKMDLKNTFVCVYSAGAEHDLVSVTVNNI